MRGEGDTLAAFAVARVARMTSATRGDPWIAGLTVIRQAGIDQAKQMAKAM